MLFKYPPPWLRAKKIGRGGGGFKPNRTVCIILPDIVPLAYSLFSIRFFFAMWYTPTHYSSHLSFFWGVCHFTQKNVGGGKGSARVALYLGAS